MMLLVSNVTLFASVMDPIKFLNIDNLEMIFRFFKPSDFLSLAMVSKSWYDFLGNTSFSMNKIVLGMRSDWNLLTEEETQILSNGRDYRNILISAASCEDITFIQQIMESKFSVTNVAIYQVNFPSPESFMKLIKTFEKTVQFLKIDAVSVECFEDCPIELNFSSLKSLKLVYCNPQIIKLFLSQCSTLKALELCYPNVKSNKVNPFAGIQPLKHLQELILSCTTEHLEVFDLGPNVEVLKMWQMSVQAATLIKKNMKKLKKIALTTPRGKRVDEILSHVSWA